MCGIRKDPHPHKAEQPDKLPSLVVDYEGIAGEEGERVPDETEPVQGAVDQRSRAEDEAGEALARGAEGDCRTPETEVDLWKKSV